VLPARQKTRKNASFRGRAYNRSGPATRLKGSPEEILISPSAAILRVLISLYGATSEHRGAGFPDSPIISMETKLSLRFLASGAVGEPSQFLLFSISFWGISSALPIGRPGRKKRKRYYRFPRILSLPSIVSWRGLHFLFVMLGMAALRWLQSGRKPVPLPPSFCES